MQNKLTFGPIERTYRDFEGKPLLGAHVDGLAGHYTYHVLVGVAGKRGWSQYTLLATLDESSNIDEWEKLCYVGAPGDVDLDAQATWVFPMVQHHAQTVGAVHTTELVYNNAQHLAKVTKCAATNGTSIDPDDLPFAKLVARQLVEALNALG